ncbi:MAG: HEPN domain-containing protein [Sandaracinaceae bacterium]
MPSIEEMRLIVEPGAPQARSVLLRPLHSIEVERDLVIVPPDALRVRRAADEEVADLIARREKKNAFARVRRDTDFYAPRLWSLSGRTVVDARLNGRPDEVRSALVRLADLAEPAVVVAGWATLGRKQLRNHLSSTLQSPALDILIGPGWTMRSSSRPGTQPSPLQVTAKLGQRGHELGVWRVAAGAAAGGQQGAHMATALFWLAEAARDAKGAAAVVKISTALEALLIVGREPITRTLSERAAFLLSDAPDRRAAVSRAVKKLYEVRSEAVHASRSSEVEVPALWLDAACKLVLAVATVLSDNLRRWPKRGHVVDWVDRTRWGAPTEPVVRNLAWRSLRPALARLARKL